MTLPTNHDILLTIEEVAQMLSVAKKTLRRWEKHGKLTTIRTPGNQRRYRLLDIASLIKITKPDKFRESTYLSVDSLLEAPKDLGSPLPYRFLQIRWLVVLAFLSAVSLLRLSLPHELSLSSNTNFHKLVTPTSITKQMLALHMSQKIILSDPAPDVNHTLTESQTSKEATILMSQKPPIMELDKNDQVVVAPERLGSKLSGSLGKID